MKDCLIDEPTVPEREREKEREKGREREREREKERGILHNSNALSN